MHRLVIATNNQGKLREFRRLLGPLGLEVVAIGDLVDDFHVDETGSTFAANAALKARAACELTGTPALADDSGLEVDALGGRPGVRSARYAGEGASDSANNDLLLKQLTEVADGARTARFRCAIALSEPSGGLSIVEGTCEGVIQRAPSGTDGFGYDPLFSVPQCGGRSFAELGPSEKDRVSHRGEALRKIQDLLVARFANGEANPSE
ncbi:MAG TPA: XTP/dITP diphosphatase [Polyangiaceae bacterium]